MLRILHIEDEAIYARLAREALRGHGGEEIEVERVDCLKAGLERLDRGPFDLVLLDLHLPDGEGVQLIERVRGVSPAVAIVGLSGTIDEREALHVVARGAQDFVAKEEVPQPGVLLRAVRYAVERQRLQLQLECRAHELAHELAESERQLLHAQRMEAIGRLAGGVAHDFNNLLTVILGYCAVLQPRQPTPDDAADLAEIEQAARRAAALTRQLLAFSRRSVTKVSPLDLNEVIDEMKGFLSRLIGEDVKVETRLAADLGRVQADRGQLEQVIVNLVVNARDAMPRGGTILLETANEPERGELGPRVLLAVHDTGCGMDEATRARIFEPFFTTKEVGKGTGLGLSTVYGIVSQFGGTIEVESQLGAGTSLFVRLPRIEAVEAGPEPAPLPRKKEGGSETVLVVEDEPVVRQLAVRFLERAGYRVLAAGGPVEALCLAEERGGAISLILTDVMMPDMSGRELVEQLQARNPRLAALYMSGYSGDVMSREGRLGADAVLLEKPFTGESLLTLVREALDRQWV